MRVLFVDQFNQPGGAQLCLKDILTEARSRGWITHVMRPGFGLPARIACYSNGRKNFGDMVAFPLDTALAARIIRRVVRREGIDLVYANGPRVLPAAAMSGRPVIFHLHSLLSTAYSRMTVRLSLTRNRAAVFAASRFAATAVLGMKCASEVRIIYNGVKDTGFAARSFACPALTVGIAGRISPEKGHIDFILAAREIARFVPQTKFVVYGAPLFGGFSYEEELRRAASGLNIEFRGWTQDISKALSGIDILAVPSAPIESSPRVILEALSAGTPVVAYPSGGVIELIRPRQTGLLTSEAIPESLARSIIELIHDRNLMRWIALNGRIDWERRFTVERFTRDICDAVTTFCQEQSELACSAAQTGLWGAISQRKPLRTSGPRL